MRREWVRYQVKRLLKFLTKLYVRYFVQSDSHAKCPACGIRKKHDVHWNEALRMVLHTCARCGANWGEQPIVQADLWSPNPQEQREPERQTTIMHAQREPKVIRHA